LEDRTVPATFSYDGTDLTVRALMVGETVDIAPADPSGSGPTHDITLTLDGVIQDNPYTQGTTFSVPGVISIPDGTGTYTLSATGAAGLFIDNLNDANVIITFGRLQGPVTIQDFNGPDQNLTVHGTSQDDYITDTSSYFYGSNDITWNHAIWLNGQASPDSSTPQELVRVPAPVNDPITIDAGDGNDWIQTQLDFGRAPSILGGAGNDTFFEDGGAYGGSLYGGSGDDTFLLSNVDGVGVDGGDGNDHIQLSNVLLATVQGGNGDDTIDLSNVGANFLNFVSTIDGGEGSDTYNVQLGDAQRALTIADSGTTGTDTLTVDGTSADDDILKASGTVQWRPLGSTDPYQETLTFSGMEHLTLNAGAGDDTILDPGSLNTTILGGPGNDTILLANADNVLADGGDGSDTYIVQFGSLGAVTIADSGTTGSDSLTVVAADGSDPLLVNGSQITQGSGTLTLAQPIIPSPKENRLNTWDDA
jgi:Ca2+-binding RTX toxin-like protein